MDPVHMHVHTHTHTFTRTHMHVQVQVELQCTMPCACRQTKGNKQKTVAQAVAKIHAGRNVRSPRKRV
jgi:hypothetical protein